MKILSLLLIVLLITGCKEKDSNSLNQEKIKDVLFGLKNLNSDDLRTNPRNLLSFSTKIDFEDSSSLIYWFENESYRERNPIIVLFNNSDSKLDSGIVYTSKSNYCLLKRETIEDYPSSCEYFNNAKIVFHQSDSIEIYLSKYHEDKLLLKID